MNPFFSTQSIARPSSLRRHAALGLLAGLSAALMALGSGCSGDPGDGNNAQCASDGAPCAAGQVCNSDGLCGPAGTGGSGGSSSAGVEFVGSSSSTGTGGDLPDSCADVTVTFDKQIPTVVLLIDQSGSMTESFGGGTRWNVLYDTLMDPGTGLVKALESDVRFGLALYTSEDGNAGGTCPMLTEVPITLGNYDAIDAVYSLAHPKGDTPTGESIDAVAAKLDAVSEPGPKVIVLATDGEPDTCAVPNPQHGQSESIAAAQAAFAKDIRTFIISVGSDVGVQHLQDVANAGVGLPVGGPDKAPYYVGLNQQALIDAFTNIIQGVRTCVFTLNGKVDPTMASQGKVTIDGQSISYGGSDGWKLNSPTEIEIVGASCDLVQTGEHTIAITFPCGSVELPW